MHFGYLLLTFHKPYVSPQNPFLFDPIYQRIRKLEGRKRVNAATNLQLSRAASSFWGRLLRQSIPDSNPSHQIPTLQYKICPPFS